MPNKLCKLMWNECEIIHQINIRSLYVIECQINYVNESGTECEILHQSKIRFKCVIKCQIYYANEYGTKCEIVHQNE